MTLPYAISQTSINPMMSLGMHASMRYCKSSSNPRPFHAVVQIDTHDNLRTGEPGMHQHVTDNALHKICNSKGTVIGHIQSAHNRCDRVNPAFRAIILSITLFQLCFTIHYVTNL